MEDLKIKKLAFATLVIFFSASLLSAQNLAEVAKREKARRAALKAQGKISILVTNADLKRRNKPRTVSAKSTVLAKSPSSVKPASSTPRRSTRQAPRPRPRPTKKRTDQQEEQQLDQSSDGYVNRKYATKVLLSSELVKNPEFALKKPDNKFAEISILGVLDLEISATNGPGEDIAIYARLSVPPEIKSAEEAEAGIPDSYGHDHNVGFWYGVSVMNKNGEWEDLARGSGKGISEKFDLGRVPSIKRIRIVFRPLTNPELPVKYSNRTSGKLTCGIDAIETLH